MNHSAPTRRRSWLHWNLAFSLCVLLVGLSMAYLHSSSVEIGMA